MSVIGEGMGDMRLPRRVQMTRQRPWRHEHPDAVIVSRPSKWGNPYTITMMQKRIDEIGQTFGVSSSLDARAMSVEAFRCDLIYGPDSIWWWYGPHQVILGVGAGLDAGELMGRDLACWCPLDQPCHADVLLELASQRTEGSS